MTRDVACWVVHRHGRLQDDRACQSEATQQSQDPPLLLGGARSIEILTREESLRGTSKQKTSQPFPIRIAQAFLSCSSQFQYPPKALPRAVRTSASKRRFPTAASILRSRRTTGPSQLPGVDLGEGTPDRWRRKPQVSTAFVFAKKTEPQLEGEVWEVFEFQEMWDVP